MRSISSQLQKVTSRILVPALLVWLIGSAGFLSCCSVDADAASSQLQNAADKFNAQAADELDAAPCPEEQDHCQKAEPKASALLDANHCNARVNFNRPMPCCSLTGQSADRVRKSRIVQERADSQALNLERSAPQEIARTSSSQPIARVVDESRFYLRHCVFLI